MTDLRCILGPYGKTIRDDSLNSELTLSLTQLLCCGWKVEQDKASDDTPSSSHSTLDNKQPSPAGNSIFAIEPTFDGASDQATEGTRENGSGDVNGETLRLLVALIPRGEEQQNTRSESGFEAPDHGTEDDQIFVVLDKSHADCDATPKEHDSWQEDGGTYAREDHVVRDYG